MWEGVDVRKKIPEKAEQSAREGEQARRGKGKSQPHDHSNPDMTGCLPLFGHVLGSLYVSLTWRSPLSSEKVKLLLRPCGQLVEEAGCEHTVDYRIHEWERKEVGGGPEPSLDRSGWNGS